MIFSILSLKAYTYEQLFELKAWVYDQLFEFNDWIFLKYLDLAKILLLGLKEIEGEILKILACLSFVSFGVGIDFMSFLLNWNEKYCLKNIFLLLADNLFHLDLYMSDINF